MAQVVGSNDSHLSFQLSWPMVITSYLKIIISIKKILAKKCLSHVGLWLLDNLWQWPSYDNCSIQVHNREPRFREREKTLRIHFKGDFPLIRESSIPPRPFVFLKIDVPTPLFWLLMKLSSTNNNEALNLQLPCFITLCEFHLHCFNKLTISRILWHYIVFL